MCVSLLHNSPDRGEDVLQRMSQMSARHKGIGKSNQLLNKSLSVISCELVWRIKCDWKKNKLLNRLQVTLRLMPCAKANRRSYVALELICSEFWHPVSGMELTKQNHFKPGWESIRPIKPGLHCTTFIWTRCRKHSLITYGEKFLW